MRDQTGRFLPGATGNAGGRPRTVGPVRELAATYTTAAVEALARIMGDESAPASARAAAAVALLDRAHGRPHSTSDVRLEAVDVNASHIEAIKALAARRRASTEDEPTAH